MCRAGNELFKQILKNETSFHICDKLIEVQNNSIDEQGKVSLLSRGGVQELQYLIFMLGVFHLFSSILTFSLGMAKVINFLAFSTVLLFTYSNLKASLSELLLLSHHLLARVGAGNFLV